MNISNNKYAEFYRKGFQIISNVLDSEEINIYKKELLIICEQQALSFGTERIQLIDEKDIARSPFLDNWLFQKLFYNKFALDIVYDILGEHAILSLQNGIIIPGKQSHHQGFYHRDIIYQEFTSSVPLAINLYYCLTDYNAFNGGTTFIVESHKKDKLVSNDSEETPTIKAGSVILFNSMVYHKTGANKTNNIRCGINNMFTLPFLKQQINYPYCLKNKTNDPALDRLLGFESREHLSVTDFRQYRLDRNYNAQ
jgi:ectoine hydroxylase-related dioxygenase (phytanoyl-CoA dioxygenase family)